MRLYICGCISVDPENYRQNFHEAQVSLARAGHQTASPLDNGLTEESSWLDHMKADIAMMLECDGVATIEGWEKGQGTRVEVDLARGLGIPVKRLAQWASEA